MSHPPLQYDPVSKLFHWVMAVLILGLLIIGFYMTRNESLPTIGLFFKLHKSFGMVAGILILARIGWRLFHHAPPLPQTVPLWQMITARSVHNLLYLSMLVMPVAGFLGASFSGRPLAFFGLAIPSWLPTNAVWSAQSFYVHIVFAWVLVVLISLHMLASTYHMIAKDGVIRKMWF